MAQMMAIDRGDSVNLTTLTMSAHSGSHIDAPFHFSDSGQTFEQLDLTPYWGKAQLVTVDKQAGPLYPKDFKTHDLGLAPRLLVHSDTSAWQPGKFPEEFVYPSPELADFLGQKGIILYGSDGPSMDRADSKDLPGHKALGSNQIAILEWLDFSGVEDGLYELAALPLKIANGDGSPVRAVLKAL
jgi:arylformamidase